MRSSIAAASVAGSFAEESLTDENRSFNGFYTGQLVKQIFEVVQGKGLSG